MILHGGFLLPLCKITEVSEKLKPLFMMDPLIDVHRSISSALLRCDPGIWPLLLFATSTFMQSYKLQHG